MATAARVRKTNRSNEPNGPAAADPLETVIAAAAGGVPELTRSYQIARERDLLGTAICIGEEGGPERAEIWQVPSGSHPTLHYRVRVEHAYGRMRCPCTAGAHHLPCAHKGATVFALYQRRMAGYYTARDVVAWNFWDGVEGTEAMYG